MIKDVIIPGGAERQVSAGMFFSPRPTLEWCFVAHKGFAVNLMEERARSRLAIVCGLPCSGKTMHARTLESRLPGFRLCPDEWMDALAINLWDEGARAKIESLQWSVAQQLLRLGTNVIIEWGTWGRSERNVLREGARKLGAAVELHFLDASVEELFRRAQQRAMEDPPMTREDLQRWSDGFERPTPDELALFDEPLV